MRSRTLGQCSWRSWIGSGLLGILGLLSVASAAAQESGPSVGVSENATLGPILTDSAGMTLYTWDRDTKDSPNVLTTASASWPPFIVPSTPAASMALPGVLGTALRMDGALQATFNGWPLYYNVRDTAPGQTNGQASGSVWWVVPLAEMPIAEMEMPMAEAPVAAGAAAVGMAEHPTRGPVLTDGRGMTVYVLAEDREAGNISTCYAENSCTIYWPPVLIEGAPVAPEGLPGQLGTYARADFTVQLIYNGQPLYYFIADLRPGQFLGDQVTDEWGQWFAVPIE